MILVVDTNVVVSATLNPHGKPAATVSLVLQGRIEIAYDSRIMAEYNEVLHRPQFQFSENQITPFLDFCLSEGVSVTAPPLKHKLPDPDDDKFLEVAIAAEADALLTGNRQHFPVELCGQVKVLSPAELLEFYCEREQT